MGIINAKNVFAHNPQRVIDPASHQTGEAPKKHINKRRTLQAGKRISKSGNVYYEYRKNRSSLHGRLK